MKPPPPSPVPPRVTTATLLSDPLFRAAVEAAVAAEREACAAECSAAAAEYARPLTGEDAWERQTNATVAGALRDAAAAIRLRAGGGA